MTQRNSVKTVAPPHLCESKFEFQYDNFGRTEYKIQTFGGSSETIQFTYDTLGRQHEIIEARGTTTYSYNSLTQISSPEGTINYEYDPVTGRKTRTTTDNTVVSYSYDTLGRLASVTDANGQTTYSYTAVGSRAGVILPNGAMTTYQYDNLNRLTNLTNVNSSNAVLSSYTYSLAPNGRRTGVVEQTSKTDAPAPSSSDFTTRNIAYTYDGLNRLTKETSECADNTELDYTSEYTYDLTGNRLSLSTVGIPACDISYTYNANDQLTLESDTVKGDTIYSYDANGSQIGKVNTTASESYMYSYNLQNRLATATIPRMENTSLVDITSAYVYNQSGIRVGANTSTTIDSGAPEVKNTVYLTDPANFTGYSQVLEESVNGTLTKSYTLGDDVLAQTVGATTSYLQYDGHGSTRLLTSATSAIAGRFDYDAYGKNLFSANVTSPASTDMLYSGEQFDPNLQMQYLRARYYDQNNGRFNRLDPFSGNNDDPQSLHKYAYCHGDGVNGIDPTGRRTLVGTLCVMATISILASMLIPTVFRSAGRKFKHYLRGNGSDIQLSKDEIQRLRLLSNLQMIEKIQQESTMNILNMHAERQKKIIKLDGTEANVIILEPIPDLYKAPDMLLTVGQFMLFSQRLYIVDKYNGEWRKKAILHFYIRDSYDFYSAKHSATNLDTSMWASDSNLVGENANNFVADLLTFSLWGQEYYNYGSWTFMSGDNNEWSLYKINGERFYK